MVYLPQLPFKLNPHELAFLSPVVTDGVAKNVSYDIRCEKLAGTDCTGEPAIQLKAMMHRYALYARQLLDNLFPHYAPHIKQARTSYRPVEIAGRKAPSYRKDDTLLHIDAFPASPVKGTRILRVFTNVNPHGQERIWRVGEPLPKVIEKFTPHIRKPLPGLARLQQLLKITRDYRTPYDHYMLHIHNTMKGDAHYQKNVPQQEVRFPAGSTWLVYTDQVSHAAMSGQYVFEQTFHLPVSGLHNPDTAPLKILAEISRETFDRKLKTNTLMQTKSPSIQLSALLSGYATYQGSDLLIAGLCVDSRLAKPGELFLASKGVQQDGRLFIEQAVQRGVVAVVYEAKDLTAQMQDILTRYAPQLPLIPVPDLDEKLGGIAARFYGLPASHMHITGITGTNGKTSCAYFLTQALSLLGKKAVMMGTIGIGPLDALQDTTHTTLLALPLQKYLHQFHQQQIEYVTMEVSSHALHQHRVGGVPFEMALFTNLTLDHLDYHQTMQAYGEAKARLFQWDSLKYAVINLDDEFSPQVINTISDGVKIIGVSLTGKTHGRCDVVIKPKI